MLGNAWQPLQPTTVERSGRVITVHFHVPVPPLAWDDDAADAAPVGFTEWAQGRGFEVRAAATRIAISGVAIAGDDPCRSPARPICPPRVVVGYASTAERHAARERHRALGPAARFRSVRRLADASAQPNYCVAFEMTLKPERSLHRLEIALRDRA